MAAGLVALVALGVTGPARIGLALAFVTFVPGWAAVGHSRAVTGVSRIALAVAASLTACTVAALAMVWLRAWHPVVVFYGLSGASVVALVAQSLRRPRPAVVPEPAPVPETVPASIPEPAPAPEAVPAVVPEPAPVLEPRRPVTVAHPVEPRRPDVPERTLRITGLAVGVAFLPRPAFASNELTGFFAAVTDRFPFDEYHRVAGSGAVLETTGVHRLEIRPDGVDYRVDSPRDFQQARRDAVELLSEVRDRLGIPSFANPTFRLHARWTPGPQAGGVTISSLFAGAALDDRRHAALLGAGGPVDVGLRFAGRSDTPEHDWRVTLDAVDPEQQVSIELVSEFHRPAEGPGAVGEHLQQARHFLAGNVVSLVEALLEPATGRP